MALAQRLGKSISRRRQYFKYGESHRGKLSAGLNFDSGKPEKGGQSTAASSIPNTLKNGGGMGTNSLEMDEEQNSDGGTQTSFATSTGNSEKLRVPPLPDEASKGPFECPFCYMIISLHTKIAWNYV